MITSVGGLWSSSGWKSKREKIFEELLLVPSPMIASLHMPLITVHVVVVACESHIPVLLFKIEQQFILLR